VRHRLGLGRRSTGPSLFDAISFYRCHSGCGHCGNESANITDMLFFCVCMIDRIEKNRLNTFDVRWPSSSVVEPRDLAKSGFYYIGVGDVVRCVFCQIQLRSWEPGDVPLNEHRKHSPSCPFLLQQDVGNVPLPNAPEFLQSPTNTFPLEWRNVSFQ